ncbi:hypothetical protein [Streptococcus suis]|uniref:hypothetical protein n=1 Tax=Streptococcus suis TaxID=1307 RepID=UPI001ABE5BA5|nr:hypothetical protein [Streptococcus suis]
MTKYNLVTKKGLKFGELEFEKNQFDFPKQLRIDFSTSRIGYEYEEKGGENVRTDRVSKLTVLGIDNAVATLLESQGLEVDALTPLEFEIHTDFDKYLGYFESKATKVIEIKDYSILPKWNSSRRAHTDVVLVAKSIKEVAND